MRSWWYVSGILTGILVGVVVVLKGDGGWVMTIAAALAGMSVAGGLIWAADADEKAARSATPASRTPPS